MSRKTVTIIYSVLFIVSLLLFSQVSWAQATRMAVSGIMTPTGGGVPDKQWFAGNNMHIRGATEMGEVTGDLEGTYSLVGNYHLNMLTGEGQSFGKITLVLTFNGLSGTFEGTYAATVSDFGETRITWSVTPGTSGDFEGMTLLGTTTWLSPGPYEYEGFIIDPHGG